MLDQKNSENAGQYIPGGVKKADIPNDQEDLYILKSQVVQYVLLHHQLRKNVLHAPPCGRCPEPDFSCKKVPNYKVMSQYKLPDFKPQMSG